MDEEKKKVIKRTVGQKVKNAVFRGDDYHTFIMGLWEGQVLPMIGDILEDQLGNIIHAVFYDDDYYDRPSRGRRGRSERDRRSGHGSLRSRNNRTDYNDTSTRRRKERRRSDPDEDYELPGDLNARETNLVPFDSRTDVEDCLYFLKGKIRDDGKVSARDFFHFSNVASTTFTNDDWGWVNERDISKAIINKKGGKYYIDLPEPVALEDDEEEYDD